jgi:ribose 1,5-bisphosphokinase
VHQSRLYYICGAPGSGKHTLTSMARDRLATSSQPIFAHRYVTRPDYAAGENQVCLSDAEFDFRLQNGCLAMHWFDGGRQVGVGIEIHQWLGMGLDVVLIGPIGYLPQAASKYPELRPILIQASTELRRRRLLQRGAEDAETVERRVRRTVSGDEIHHAGLRVIDNNGLVHTGVEQLLQLFKGDAETRCA